jgi:hypothetical protein
MSFVPLNVRVTTHCDTDLGVVEHMGHQFSEANGVRPEAVKADRIGHMEDVVDIHWEGWD